ncbi:hypothetical protein LAZ40_21640 [Cereibacter sphaeroides]|uniref:RSP_7527 family protein n=1 Tax=Rhodobacterales TaxID=204455 RepID=UPI000BBECC5A|nr:MULTISPECIES: hypothetical protein [Paracoccaceae]MCE6961638.1 hypothetical protein [Cereibacter sphaeroides]MCE6968100.1 hypothetical protein [Cereibacter sphaeroides]MCE6974988.1 hypothetical protein [Cereibacter sphaeroides]
MTRMNGMNSDGYVIDHVAVEAEARRMRNDAIRAGLVALGGGIRRRLTGLGHRAV